MLKSLNNVAYKGKFRSMAFRDHFIPHGDVETLMKNEKMDVDEIVYLAKKLTK